MSPSPVPPVTRKIPAAPATERGLRCRACGCAHLEVLYTRRGLGGKVLRRRACRHCGRRMTTAETAVA